MRRTQELISGLMKTKAAPGDYIGEDGLLYCGKCHTPKQHRMDCNPKTGEPVPTLVPIACQCRRQEEEVRETKDRHEKFCRDMERRREDGIACPDGLRWTFAQDDRRQPKVSDACLRYVGRWKEMRANNIGILLYGGVGTGKSFLASCIGNGILEQLVPVVSTNFARLLNLLQGSYEKQALLDRLSVYKLLIVDDLGIERDSAYAREQIFNVIDARSRSRLPLIVTTNLTLDELKHPTSMQYARIYDRVLEMCPICLKLTGESRRAVNTEQRKNVARQLLFE